MKHVTCIALCLSSFVAFAAIGCSGAADPVPTSSSKKASTAGDSTKAPNGSTNAPAGNGSTATGGTAAASSTPLSDSAACGKKADAMTCDDCCVATSPMALVAADQAEGDCMCAAAACQTACSASVCAASDNMNQPTDACFTCLDSHQAECSAKFDAACTSAECKAVVSCMATQCDPLATMAGGSSGGGSSGARVARETSSASTFSAIRVRVSAPRSADRQ
jgi:hypothetical protein